MVSTFVVVPSAISISKGLYPIVFEQIFEFSYLFVTDFSAAALYKESIAKPSQAFLVKEEASLLCRGKKYRGPSMLRVHP